MLNLIDEVTGKFIFLLNSLQTSLQTKVQAAILFYFSRCGIPHRLNTSSAFYLVNKQLFVDFKLHYSKGKTCDVDPTVAQKLRAPWGLVVGDTVR